MKIYLSTLLCFIVFPSVFPYISAEAVAPVMISTSSPVITAWRVLLKRIWYLPIISPAFLEAFCFCVVRISTEVIFFFPPPFSVHLPCLRKPLLRVGKRIWGETVGRGPQKGGREIRTSIAFRLAEISHAWPSARAQYIEFARANSFMLLSTASSSTSNAANLAVFEKQRKIIGFFFLCVRIGFRFLVDSYVGVKRKNKLTGLEKRPLVEDWNVRSLIGGGVDKPVIQDLDL